MSFHYKWVLMLIPLFLIGAIGLFWFNYKVKRRALENWILKDLEPVLVQGKIGFYNSFRFILWTLAGVCILVALARPEWGESWQEVQVEKAEVVFAIDTSKSMLAEDLKPNRIKRAKLVVMDIVQKLKATRVGLIAFAGEAFLQCPVTVDYDAFQMALDEIDVGIIYQGGTHVAAALKLAETVFDKNNKVKILVLLTDGEDLEQAGIEEAKHLAQEGIHVYTIGIGSTSGELVPVRTQKGEVDFLKDAEGKIVTTRLDEPALKAIAQETGATYTNLQASVNDLDNLVNTIQEKLPKDKLGVYKKRIPNEQFQWFIGAVILLFILEMLLEKVKLFRFRSQKIVSIIILLFAFLFVFQNESIAEEQDSQPSFDYEAYLKKNLKRLPAESNNAALLYNLGTASFGIEDYSQSLSFFDKALEIADIDVQQKVYYNLGNTRYRLGEQVLENHPQQTLKLWEEGLKNYENALQLDPKDEDAQFNFEFLKKKLEELKNQLEQNPDSKPQDQGGENQESDNNSDQKNENQDNQKENQSKDNNSSSQEDKSSQDQNENKKDQKSDGDQNQPQSQGKDSQKKDQNSNDESKKNANQQDKQVDGEDEEEDTNQGLGMSKKEAMQVLDSAREGEQRLPVQKYPVDSKNKKDNKAFKDW